MKGAADREPVRLVADPPPRRPIDWALYDRKLGGLVPLPAQDDHPAEAREDLIFAAVA